MSGKKGSTHLGWDSKPKIVNCLMTLWKNDYNVKKSARELGMTHQYLRWVCIRAGKKPGGKPGKRRV